MRICCLTFVASQEQEPYEYVKGDVLDQKVAEVLQYVPQFTEKIKRYVLQKLRAACKVPHLLVWFLF